MTVVGIFYIRYGGIFFMQNIDTESINTLRFLSIDEVQAANSGHPGLPLGTAPTDVHHLGPVHEIQS